MSTTTTTTMPRMNGYTSSAAMDVPQVQNDQHDKNKDHNAHGSSQPPPVKRKRGRPPKIRKVNHSTESIVDVTTSLSKVSVEPAQQHGPSSSSSTVVLSLTNHKGGKNNKKGKHISTSQLSLRKSLSKISSPPHHAFRQRRRSWPVSNKSPNSSPWPSTHSWTAPQDDLEGTLLNHPVTLAPILPPVLLQHHDLHKCPPVDSDLTTNQHHDEASLQARYPAVYNDGGVPKDCTIAVAPFSSAFSQSNSTLSLTTTTKNQPLSQPTPLPSWTPLYTPPVYFEDDYDRETGQLDVDAILPVTRSITALTVRKPHHDYLVLGDSAGFVLIYTLDQIHRPVARLESLACQQRARPEQERLRAELRRKRTKATKSTTNNNHKSKTKRGPFALMSSSTTTTAASAITVSGPQSSQSILMDTSDTTIHALGMIGDRVVLATTIELECLDVPSATSLWVCPLTSNRFVTSLDMHLHTFDVLVSCSKTPENLSSQQPTPASTPPAAAVSSLMLLQHSHNNVEICDANSPMLVRSPSCTAIWDVGCNNRLLFVALSANRPELELVLVSGGKSIDQWKVACKTKIPTKSGSAAASQSATVTNTKLTQSMGGQYTLVASSRGIRLYQTETLQLLHVYGDQLSLHGQSVMWKDCWLAASFYQEGKGIHKTRLSSSAPWWLEVEDWLAYSYCAKTDQHQSHSTKSRDAMDSSAISTTDLPPYIVGVPHVKGPRELCETLHVWKVEHPSVVPSLTIPLPHKGGGGALGLVGGGQDRIILATNDGQGHQLLPKMESNFAGIMYPPGYQVITDNIEFIEEEDALDEVVQHNDGSDGEGESEDEVDDDDEAEDEEMDEELKEAMRQSLLEHQRQEEAWEAVKHDQEVDIIVVDDDDGLIQAKDFLPCRPEPFLRQFIHTPTDDEEDDNEHDEVMDPNKQVIEKTSATTSANHLEKLEGVSTTAAFLSNVLEALPNMEKPLPVEDEDCLSFTTTKVVVAVNPVPIVPARPGRGRKSRPGNVESMLKASINPYLQSMMLGRQGVPADGSGSRLVKEGEEENAFFNVLIDTQPSLSGEGNNGNNTRYSTPDPKSTTADEAAVALGLLGLSPNPNNALSRPIDVLAPLGVAPPVTTTTSNANSHAPMYLSASTLLSLPIKPSTTAAHTPEIFNHTASGVAESLTASSDRGSVTEDSVGDLPMVMIKQKTDHGSNIVKNCHACRGRLVVHSCGKRALPIDYDEVAKAERERRERECEEKKRLRAEKRRLADQRRREAKKQKQRELEEQRLREEDEEKQENERQMRLQQDFASQDLNRMRRDQIVAAYAEFQEQGSLEVNFSQPEALPSIKVAPKTLEAVVKPSIPSTFKQHSRPRVGSIFEQASRMMDDSTVRKHISAGEAAAIYNKTSTAMAHSAAYSVGTGTREQGYTAPTPLAIPPVPTLPAANHLNNNAMASAAAQLEAFDGLAALAELARATPAATSNPPSAGGEPMPALSSFSYAVAPPISAPENNPASFSHAVSHGFGAVRSGGEVKRGIPSYATIRGQAKDDTDHVITKNAIQHQTLETYTWPPPREQQE
jgi:hypothetical protein